MHLKDTGSTKEWSKQVFSKNLRRYMESSGKTQKEIAEIAGVTAPTFNEWIRGKKFPRIDKVQKLADYFGIKKSDLIEEKLTDEQKAGNEALAGIIVRLRMDAGFRQIVETLDALDAEKLKGVQQMLDAFAK
jgi:transcriptional regulator with XRE-family HTH domain